MSEPSDTIYVVKSNEETIYTVSALHGLTVEELLLSNNLNYDSTLTIGQELIVKSENLHGSLLFGLEDYHSPDCSGCNQNIDNCGNPDCECECENISGTTHCAGEGSCQ